MAEKAVAQQFISYITVHNLGESLQSAYKELHSTETALLCVQNDIRRATDNCRSVILVLLHLSGAFDTVDHSILLERLQSRFGVVGKAHAYFESYLSNRKQSVVAQNAESGKSIGNWFMVYYRVVFWVRFYINFILQH